MFGISRISGLLPEIIGKDRPAGPNGGGRRASGQHFAQTELTFKHADGGFDPATKPLQFSKPLGAFDVGFHWASADRSSGCPLGVLEDVEA